MKELPPALLKAISKPPELAQKLSFHTDDFRQIELTLPKAA